MSLITLPRPKYSGKLACGPNLALDVGPDSRVLTQRIPNLKYSGAWSVGVKDTTLTVGVGFVNYLEPKINKVNISGVSDDGEDVGIPELQYSKGFLCIKCTLKESLTTASKKEIDEKSLKIVISSTFGPTDDDDGWLQPIAVLGDDWFHQMAYFDYTHVATRGIGKRSDKWDHAFTPSMSDTETNTIGKSIIRGPAPVNWGLMRWKI